MNNLDTFYVYKKGEKGEGTYEEVYGRVQGLCVKG